MKCKKMQSLDRNGFVLNSLIPWIAVIVISMLSLLTITRNSANADMISLSSKSDTSDTCVACNGKEFLYNQNTTFMKDAAINYFTNERLPQTLNSSKKLTLKEMLDEKLLYKLVDSNGKACSTTDSYVEVTKLENEYLFKINLSCSDITDYILVHQGCYNYCNDSSCEPKKEEPKVEPKKEEDIYEYEFKKTVGCVMSDWSAWSEWTTERQQTSNNKREESRTETVIESKIVEADKILKTVYNCDQFEGYKLVGDKCVSSTGKLDEKEATKNPTTYNCDKYPGYTLKDNKCVKTIETVDEVPADENSATYNCDKYPGYKLSGTKCIKTTETEDSKPADENEATYNCNKYSGYTLKGTKCVKEIETTDEKDADKNPTTYNCDKYPGYTLSGSKCIKKTTVQDEKDADKNPTTYNCNKYSGYTLSGTKCIKDTSHYDYADLIAVWGKKTEYYGCKRKVCTTKVVEDCSSGDCIEVPQQSCTYVDDTCSREVDAIVDYKCPDNYSRSGDQCRKYVSSQDTKKADENPATYNCNKYPGYTLSGTKCIKSSESEDSKPADENPATYNCNKYSGYTLSGTKCIKKIKTTDEKDADKNPTTYNCNKYPGYTLSGTKCIKKTETTDEKDADKNPTTYNCDKYDGYTLVGTKCVKAICDVCMKDAIKEEIQVCPDGYNENNTKCTKVENVEKQITYYRYSTRTCNGGYSDTKWTTNYNDSTLLNNGYRRTGNKRPLTITK